MSLNIVDLEATLGLNANDYNQGIKKAQELAKKMTQRIAELEKKFKDTGKVTKAEAQELRTLTSQINTLNSSMLRVANASEKYNKAQATGKNVDQARNKLTQESSSLLNRLTTSQVSIANATEKSNKRTNALNGFMGSMVGKFAIANIAVNALMSTISKLSASLKEATDNAFEFQKRMALVNTIVQTSKDGINKLGTQVADMAINLKADPKDLASGMYDVVSSVDDTVDKMDVLEKATKAAKAGYTDVGTAVKSGVQVANAYGMKMTELNKVYDIQFKTLDKGILNYREYSQALGNVISSATKANVPLEVFSGQLVALTKSGLDASEATTSLGRFYDSVYEKSKKFEKLNIKVFDPKTGDLKDTTVILEELFKVLENYSSIDKINILKELGFEVRSSKTVELIGENINKTRKYIDDMYNSAGQMEQAYTKAIDTVDSASIEGNAKVQKAMDEFRQNNEGLIKDLIESWSDFKVLLIEIADILLGMFDGKGSKVEEDFKEIMDSTSKIAKESTKTIDEQFTEQLKKTGNHNEQFLKNSLINYKNSIEGKKAYIEEYKKLGGKLNSDELKEQKKTSEEFDKFLQDVYKGRIDLLQQHNLLQQTEVKDNADKMSKIYSTMADSIIDAFNRMITASGDMKKQVGEQLIQTLEFYVNFTKGMSAEVKKQVSVEAAMGQARSVLAKGGTLEQAKTSAYQTYTLTSGTLGLNESGQEDIIAKMRANINKKVKPVGSSEDLFDNNNNKDKENKKVLTESELIKQIEKQAEDAKEIADLFGTSKEELNNTLAGIYERGAETAVENDWTKTASNFAGESKNFKQISDSLKLSRESMEELPNLVNDMGNESVDFFNNMIDNFDEEQKMLDDLNKKTTEKIQSEKQATVEQQNIFDSIFASLGEATNLDELKNIQDEIIGKYSDNTVVLDYLNTIYPSFLSNLNNHGIDLSKLSNSMSDVASLTSELANLFEDDLLDAMSSVLSSVASGAASYASGNMLGVATSVISIASIVKDVLSGSNGIAEKQAEAYEQFQNAVEDFQSAIDDLSLGEAITYAKLEELDLSSASASTTGGSSGATLEDSLAVLFTGDVISAISSFFGSKPSDATIDTSSIKELLTSAGYTDLAGQVDSMIGNYAQYSSYTNWYGKSKSYVSGYDVEGFLEELQILLDEAWRQNLNNLKEAVGLSSDDFTSNLIDVFKNGGEISDSVNDMFYNAVVQAFYNQEAFQTLNSLLGDTLSEYMLSQLGDLGIDMTLSGTLEEQLQQYYDIYGESADILSDILEKLGISAESASESLSSLSSQNLPSGLKTALAQYQATNTSYSEKTTSFNTIYQIENNYSKDFSDMVNNVVNKTRYVSTNNVRGSY